MNILIVAKQSKVEYEQSKFGLSYGGLVAKYRAEHADLGAILESHERQVVCRQRLRELLPDADLLLMDALTAPVEDYEMVISFGGDNCFTYTSHYVGRIPLVGMNSDPAKSTGALCAWSSRDLEDAVARITRGDYAIEGWPLLEAEIDGTPIAKATSEYFFGERLRKDMSRHVLAYRGKEYEQKSSGLIVATGAGSTGWYHSSNRHAYPEGNTFPKTERKAAFVVTEPFRWQTRPDDVFAGDVLPGEELVLHSLNDGEGYAIADSWDEYDFSRGKEARIRLSADSLNVVVP